MAILVRPSERYEESFLEALREARDQSEVPHRDYEELSKDFNRFVRGLLDKEDRSRVGPGRVPESVYWLVEGDSYIGRLSLRHELNDHLRQIGGHIGYDIRPAFRRKGYGRQIVELGLEKARELGLPRVLLTCDFDNVASRKIIEHHGGVLEDQAEVEGHPVSILRYWIERG